MPKEKAKPLVKKETTQTTLPKDTIILITEFVMIDYNLILDEVSRNISEETAFEHAAFLTLDTMRYILHIDVLNTLIMRAIAFKQTVEHVQRLELYHSYFCKVYSGLLVPSDESEIYYRMESELKIDDFITKIPAYNPYERICGSIGSWLNPETMSDILSALLGDYFDYTLHEVAFRECRSRIYDKLLEEVLRIHIDRIHVKKLNRMEEF